MKRFFSWIGFLSVVISLPGQAGIHKDVLFKAIDTYTPLVVFHKEEKFFPTTTENFLSNTTPYEYEDRDSHVHYRGLRLNQSEPYAPQTLYGQPQAAKVYLNIKVGESTTDIQYWLLYTYNGPGTAYLKKLNAVFRYDAIGDYELGQLGVHEGDWEHITVRVDNDSGLAVGQNAVFLTAHGDGEYHNLQDLLVTQGGSPRIRVFSSRNGHAFYPSADRHYTHTVKMGVVEFRLLNDTSEPGLTIDFQNRTQIIGVQGDEELKAALGFQPPSYIADYPGRWGRISEKEAPVPDIPLVKDGLIAILKQIGVYDEFTFEAGPNPPWSKDSWTKGE